MDQQKTVKIEISGKLSYADDITLSQAAQIIAFIDSSSSTEILAPGASTQLAPVTLTSTTSRSASANPRDAIDTTGAKTNPEKIVALASTVLDGEKDTFTLDEIKPLFRRAREATPKNLSRDLDNAVRSGWVADADQKGEFYLTSTGHDVLDNGFDSIRSEKSTRTASSRRPRTNGSSRPRKTTVEVPALFKEVDPIPTSIDGLPDYNKLTTNRDRFLWVLRLAKEIGADGLENSEIVWVSDHLGAGLPGKQMTNLFERARQKGHVNRSTQTGKIRLGPDGEAALKALGAGA